MKRIIFLPVFLALGIIPTLVYSQTSPPHLINLQAVLVDEGGNVLYNQQEADIIFSIVDGAGETFYEEEQHVVLVNGAISVLVGQGIDLSTGGATGGIPLTALEPNGTKLLRVKLKDQSIPQEDLELATVPYAMYADKAYSLVEPLESSGILDGTIAQVDLSPELIAYIDDRAGGASEDQVTQHRQEDGAHPASSISVVNTFINASGSNVQQVLIGLDRAIGTRRNQEGVLGEEIDEETADRTAADMAETAAREAAVSAEAATRAAAVATEAASRAAADVSEAGTREAADTAEATARETADTAESTTRSEEDVRVLESEISRAGDTIYGDLTFYTDETLSTQTMSIAPATGNLSSIGEMSLLDGLVSINRDASTSDPILSIDDADGVERLRLDGDTGLMTITGDVSITGTVDGVDVSTEQANRISVDEAERSERISNDDILQSNISAERLERSAADVVLTTAVGTAQSTADTAVANALAAQSTADTAVSSAAAAQGTANTAVSDAGAAQTTANTAVTNAGAAQTTANTAVTNAGVAQTTANTAVTNAATAQTTADVKVSKSGDTMTGPLTFRSSDNTTKLNIGNENGSILMKGNLTMEGGNINMSGGMTVDGVNVSQIDLRMKRTPQVVMPRGDDNFVVTRDISPPGSDYSACAAWGVLDAMTVNGGGGDFDDDDHWGPGFGSQINGSAVGVGLVNGNTVRIYCRTSGNDAHYACRGFALFAREISCSFSTF